jgi:RNA polymerase sigma-70 factor, ECF subfamily
VLKRTNEQWLQALGAEGPEYDEALRDLRKTLLAGLKRGLLSQVNTTALEFETQAEDFVQEALVKILHNLHTFAGRSQFTTWAHKIALSLTLTELRRKRWQDTSLDSLLETNAGGSYLPKLVADPAPLPEKATERSEMLAYVSRLIQDELTEKQYQVLETAVLQNKPTAEVARLMEMTPNAIYKMLHDARSRLKQRLADEGLNPSDVMAVFE